MPDKGLWVVQARCSLQSAELLSQRCTTSARTGCSTRRGPCQRRSSGPLRWCVQPDPVNSLGPVCLGVIGTERNGLHGPGTGQPLCLLYVGRMA